jgi:hypothetical protein
VTDSDNNKKNKRKRKRGKKIERAYKALSVVHVMVRSTTRGTIPCGLVGDQHQQPCVGPSATGTRNQRTVSGPVPLCRDGPTWSAETMHAFQFSQRHCKYRHRGSNLSPSFFIYR